MGDFTKWLANLLRLKDSIHTFYYIDSNGEYGEIRSYDEKEIVKQKYNYSYISEDKSEILEKLY